MEQVTVNEYEVGKYYKCIKPPTVDKSIKRTVGKIYKALEGTTSNRLIYKDDSERSQSCYGWHERWELANPPEQQVIINYDIY